MTLGCGILALALLAFGCWVVWWGSFWLIDRLVDFVPPVWEDQLDQPASDPMARRQLEDPVVTQAVKTIFQRVVKALPPDQPYDFRLMPVWEPYENAFAVPGGRVLITSALLASAESPDEVAGVLGHEMTHVLRRHALHGMAHGLGVTLVLHWILGDQGLGGLVANGSSQLMGLSFSRQQESEADQGGVRYADEAGYRPDALAEFFRRQERAAALDPAAQRLLAILADHPADADRLEQIDTLAASLPARPGPSAADRAAWGVVRQHAGDIPAQFKQPEPESSD